MALNRRRFLQGLGASVAAASLTAACGGRNHGGDDMGSGGAGGADGGAGPDGGPDQAPPDQQGPATLTGRIVRPGDPDYDAARLGYNGRFSLHPQLIVYAANATDVANAVRWARQNDVALRARSSGHSYEAY